MKPSLRLLLCLAATWLGLALPASAAERPLNLLLITADDLDSSSLGCMGSKVGATPNLDAFAAKSFCFVHGHVSAPMPGLVVNVAVSAGDEVKKGQKLLTMEAMKMETTVYAEMAGTIAEVLVKPGAQVEAGDLLLRIGE